MPTGRITRSVTPDGYNVFSIYLDSSPDKVSGELVTNSKNQIVGVFSTDDCHVILDMAVTEDMEVVRSASVNLGPSHPYNNAIGYMDPATSEIPEVPFDDSQSLFFQSVVVAGNDDSQVSSVIHRDGYDTYIFDTPRSIPDSTNYRGIFIDIDEEFPPAQDVYIATRGGEMHGNTDFMIVEGDVTATYDASLDSNVMQANGFTIGFKDAGTASYQEGELAFIYDGVGPNTGKDMIVNGQDPYPALTPQTGEIISDATLEAMLVDFAEETGLPAPPTPTPDPTPPDLDVFSDIGALFMDVASSKLTPWGIAATLAAHSNKTANKRQSGFDAIMDAIEVLQDKKHGSWKKAIGEKVADSGEFGEIEMMPVAAAAVAGREGPRAHLLRRQDSGLELEDRKAKAVQLLRFAKQKFDGSRRSIIGNDFAVNFAMAFDAYCEAEKITDKQKKGLANLLQTFLQENKSDLDKRSYYPPVNPISDATLAAKSVAAGAAYVATKASEGLARVFPSREAMRYSQPVLSTSFDKIETWTQKGLDEKDYELINHHLTYAQAGLTSAVGNLAADSLVAKAAEKLLPGKGHHAQKSRDYGKADLRWYQALGHRLGGAFVDVFKVGNLEDNYEKLGRFTQAGRDLRIELALDDLQNLIAEKAKLFIESDSVDKEVKFSKEEIALLKTAHQKLSTFSDSKKSAENFKGFFELELKKVLAVFAETGVGKNYDNLTNDHVTRVTTGFQKLFTNSKADLSSVSVSKDKKSFSAADAGLGSFEGVTFDAVNAEGALHGFVATEVQKLLGCSKDRDNTLVRLAREVGIGGGVSEEVVASVKAESAKALARKVLSRGRSGGGGGGGGGIA
jgi:hypothetical protein